MAYNVVLPLAGEKVNDYYQKHPCAGSRRSQADPFEAPIQSNAKDVTYRYSEEYRSQHAVYQGKKSVAAADKEAVDAEYKWNKKKIVRERTEVSNPVMDHPGIVAKKHQNLRGKDHYQGKKSVGYTNGKKCSYPARGHRPVDPAGAEILRAHGGNRGAHCHDRHESETVELPHGAYAGGRAYPADNVHYGGNEHKRKAGDAVLDTGRKPNLEDEA
jgi:hypothetical protein